MTYIIYHFSICVSLFSATQRKNKDKIFIDYFYHINVITVENVSSKNIFSLQFQMRGIAEFKHEYIKVLKNLTPDDEKSAFVDNDIVNVLTNLDQDGRRVLIVNCGGVWDTKKVSADSLFRIFYLIHVAAQVEPNTQVRGVVVIMDFDGLGLSQVRALTPSFSKRLITFIQDAMPIRLKQVHIINQPFVFNMVWKLFKPFIREKLGSRVNM